jgi:phospholipid/cholesterol/gamma-HCH transport system substrate-binding protein
MEAEARYTYVGAAVIALLLALAGAVVWLKGSGARGDYNYYAIYFEEQALDGLQVGGEVNLRGIKVGRVQDYILAPTKLNRVRVEIRVDRRVPVRTNTVAVVSRNFVTGIAAIALVNREPAGEPLTTVREGDQLPVIAEGQSNIDELTGRVAQVGDLASTALRNVNELLAPENRRDVTATLKNLRDLTAGLTARLAALDKTLDRAGVAANSISVAGNRLGKAGDRVATVVERTGAGLDTTLAQTSQALEDARASLARAVNSIEAVQKQTGATAQRLEQSAVNVDDQLSVATSELRLSAEAAARVLDRLRDPRAALLGPGSAQLGPGEGGQ